MAVFRFPFWRSPQSRTRAVPPATPPGALTPPQPKTLTELEREMEAEARAAQAQLVKNTPSRFTAYRSKRLVNQFLGIAVLLGIPVGIVAIANLPYPAIRRPVAENVPMLLLPSQISMDHSFRRAIAAMEQAKQLIDSPTSAADLEQGGKALAEAQKHLDALPLRLDYWDDSYYYWYGWYPWRLSPLALNHARAEAGRLQARLFQETNAQSALVRAQDALKLAKQQYEQSTAAGDQQTAIASWRSALDQLGQIPSETLAGRTARQLLESENRNLAAIAGTAAANQQITTLMQAARQFSWQAARQAQNPPHSVAQWREVENLWEKAIAQLQQVSPNDPNYVEVQRQIASYQSNLSEIRVRRQEEEEAIAAFQNAQQQLEVLVAHAANTDPNWNVSRIQSIINELRKVKRGTTPYVEAQELLVLAQQKLAKFQ